MRTLAKRSWGFTLMELVLVIAITGVLFAVAAVVKMGGRPQFAHTAAQKIRADLEHARGLAMTNKGTVYGVAFNVAANQYTVYETSASMPVVDPLTKQNLIETFGKWSGVHLTGSNYTVEFDQLGAPTTGGGGGISVTDGTNTYQIEVFSVTGKINVQ